MSGISPSTLQWLYQRMAVRKVHAPWLKGDFPTATMPSQAIGMGQLEDTSLFKMRHFLIGVASPLGANLRPTSNEELGRPFRVRFQEEIFTAKWPLDIPDPQGATHERSLAFSLIDEHESDVSLRAPASGPYPELRRIPLLVFPIFPFMNDLCPITARPPHADLKASEGNGHRHRNDPRPKGQIPKPIQIHLPHSHLTTLI
jgi:hypothetical protein